MAGQWVAQGDHLAQGMEQDISKMVSFQFMFYYQYYYYY